MEEGICTDIELICESRQRMEHFILIVGVFGVLGGTKMVPCSLLEWGHLLIYLLSCFFHGWDGMI